MTSDYPLYQSIDLMLDYIEENLKSKITLDDISNEVHISKFHLNRIFHTISSRKLMEYVRQRKLSCSTRELLETDLKIADISQEYCFSYEPSYIRAFERLFGLSPRQFRLQKPSVEIKDKLNMDYILKIDRGIVALDPPIVLIPEFYVAGVRNQIPILDDWISHAGNRKGNEFYTNLSRKIENAVNPSVYIGLVEYPDAKPNYTFYTPSVQISQPFHPAGGVTCRRIPTNKYVVFRYIGLHHASQTNISMLVGSLHHAVTEWFGKSGYLQAAPYHFEKIDGRITRSDYCEVEVYFPIRLKTGADQEDAGLLPDY